MVVDIPVGGMDVDVTSCSLPDNAVQEPFRSFIVPDEHHQQASSDKDRSNPSSDDHKNHGMHGVGEEYTTRVEIKDHPQHNTPRVQGHAVPTQRMKPKPMKEDQYEIFKVLSKNEQFASAVELGDATEAARVAACALSNLVRGFMREQVHKGKRNPSSSSSRKGKVGPLYTPTLVRSLQREMLELEEAIPWNCVRKIWKNKRATWRRQVKQTIHVSGFALKVKELKHAVLIDDSVLMGCGPEWTSAVERCAQGLGSASQFHSIWDEMKACIQSWIYFTSPTPAHAEIDSLPTSLALKTLREAMVSTDRPDKASILLQVPLESMIGPHSQRLASIRDILEVEKQKLLIDGQVPAIEHDFDSGAETDEEILTDIDETCDVFCRGRISLREAL